MVVNLVIRRTDRSHPHRWMRIAWRRYYDLTYFLPQHQKPRTIWWAR